MTSEITYIAKESAVESYESSAGVFHALIQEIRELSKKKPDATLSKGKVSLINKILSDLLSFLAEEPQGKYLELLDDDLLPQVSDALLMMAQFNAALSAFHSRYNKRVSGHGQMWMTQTSIDKLAAEKEDEDEDFDL